MSASVVPEDCIFKNQVWLGLATVFHPYVARPWKFLDSDSWTENTAPPLFVQTYTSYLISLNIRFPPFPKMEDSGMCGLGDIPLTMPAGLAQERLVGWLEKWSLTIKVLTSVLLLCNF